MAVPNVVNPRRGVRHLPQLGAAWPLRRDVNAIALTALPGARLSCGPVGHSEKPSLVRVRPDDQF